MALRVRRQPLRGFEFLTPCVELVVTMYNPSKQWSNFNISMHPVGQLFGGIESNLGEFDGVRDAWRDDDLADSVAGEDRGATRGRAALSRGPRSAGRSVWISTSLGTLSHSQRALVEGQCSGRTVQIASGKKAPRRPARL